MRKLITASILTLCCKNIKLYCFFKNKQNIFILFLTLIVTQILAQIIKPNTTVCYDFVGKCKILLIKEKINLR